MPEAAAAVLVLLAKYGPDLAEKLVDIAHKPKPTREEWKAVFAEARALDYDAALKAAEERAAAKA